MKFLVDANILSEPTKTRPNQAVLNWLNSHDADLLVSPIILGEMEYGILLLPRGRKRTALQKWFLEGRKHLNSIPLDVATAEHWAKLLADLRKTGQAMPIKDSLIAATAKQHKLTVATRNVRDFKKAGVRTVNPFEQ